MVYVFDELEQKTDMFRRDKFIGIHIEILGSKRASFGILGSKSVLFGRGGGQKD